MNTDPESSRGIDPHTLRDGLPSSPGVYLFKDDSGRVIYVGKAKNLNRRIMSYFRSRADLPEKTAHMMSKAAGIDTIVTGTEQEAFILEGNLIKKFLPRYNVILRDDKRYPMLRLGVQEPFPRLAVVRKVRKDGALYFGPYSSAGSLRSTLKAIERIFPIRKCRGKSPPKRSRPCINHQMGRCLGICVHPAARFEYDRVVTQVRLFLEGRNKDLSVQLHREMLEASSRLEFERAAMLRDQIAGIERVIEKQHVVSSKLKDLDVVGYSGADGTGRVAVLHVRKGALVGSMVFSLDEAGSKPAEIMEAFLSQHYARRPFIPPEIFLSDPLEDGESMERWLGSSAGKKIRIHCPARGEKRNLVRMAVKNAGIPPTDSYARPPQGLSEMVMEKLSLDFPPRHIEGLDISNIHGQSAVGSVVSFVDGLPHRDGYRTFHIDGVQGIDDYGMMAQLVSRRLGHEPLPDLFLVDGGKGHLSAVLSVLEAGAAGKVPAVAAIAKADQSLGDTADKLYVPGRKNSLSIRRNDPVLLFMMRIRDEAHRRAVGFHRALRSRRMQASVLDLIPGVGEARKKALLEHFRSVDEIAEAGPERIGLVPGIPAAIARRIADFLAFGELPHS